MDMIEKVALAIERAMFIPEELPVDPELHAKYREVARAAIEAYETKQPAPHPMLENAWEFRGLDANEIIEICARMVDECNREGPYNAIGAASRIRALKVAPQ